MYPSTENLLKIRDGELVDAEAVAYVDADARARGELERLRRVQRDLNELPEFAPPDGVWERVLSSVDGIAPVKPQPLWQWPLRAAIAASVAAIAIVLVGRQPDAVDPLASGPATIVAESAPSNAVEEIRGTLSYASLVSESARLERALKGFPNQSGVMRAGTVSQIAAFENEIAAVDYQLMYANLFGLTAQERYSLVQHRVNVLNALVALRYGQAQR